MEFGTGATAIGLLKSLYELYKDFTKWQEEDKQISFDWIKLAKEKGQLDPKVEYGLVRPNQVEEHLLAGSHDLVYAYDEKKKIKFRLVIKRADGVVDLVLMAKK